MDIRYQIYQEFYEFVSTEMCLPPLSQKSTRLERMNNDFCIESKSS